MAESSNASRHSGRLHSNSKKAENELKIGNNKSSSGTYSSRTKGSQIENEKKLSAIISIMNAGINSSDIRAIKMLWRKWKNRWIGRKSDDVTMGEWKTVI